MPRQLWKKLFVFRENVHNSRNLQVMSNKNIKTMKYGLETIYHFFFGQIYL